MRTWPDHSVDAFGLGDARSANRGFALVDVIVATIILAVALGAIISISGRAIRAAQDGEELAIAASLADEQLHLVLARGADEYAKRFPAEGACDAPFERFSYRLDFAGGRSAAEPYEVTATIRWPGPARDDRELAINTLVAPRQIGADAEADPSRKPTTTIERGGQ